MSASTPGGSNWPLASWSGSIGADFRLQKSEMRPGWGAKFQFPGYASNSARPLAIAQMGAVTSAQPVQGLHRLPTPSLPSHSRRDPESWFAMQIWESRIWKARATESSGGPLPGEELIIAVPARFARSRFVVSGTTRTDWSARVNVSLCQITTGLRPVCSLGRYAPRSAHQTSPRFKCAPLRRVRRPTQ